MNAATLADLQDAWADAEPAHTAAELRMAGAFLAMAQRARLNASTQAQRADDAHMWTQADRGPLPVFVNKAWARERALRSPRFSTPRGAARSANCHCRATGGAPRTFTHHREGGVA